MKKLNLAIIGQGRSGKDIHGLYYISDKNIYFNVKYVVDANERRREISKERYPGCEVFENYTSLFDKKDIDLVVNATYSYMHYSITKDLLEHGFNVLVEKPFCRNQVEAETLINLANEKGLLLECFQQTFYAPYYKHLLEVIESGKLGELLEVSVRFNGFSRRWDWQTLQKKMGGNAYNTGPHPFGIALGILGFDKNTKVAYSCLKTSQMSSGDSDDYCKVILDTPNKPVVDIEINNTDAYTGYNVKIQGSKGCIKANPFNYEMKYIVEGENEDRPVVEEFLHDENYNPLYCSEKLNFHEEKGEYKGTAFDVGTEGLYEDIYFYLTEGRKLFVTAENAKEIIRVIETIHAVSPLKIKY